MALAPLLHAASRCSSWRLAFGIWRVLTNYPRFYAGLKLASRCLPCFGDLEDPMCNPMRDAHAARPVLARAVPTRDIHGGVPSLRLRMTMVVYKYLVLLVAHASPFLTK